MRLIYLSLFFFSSLALSAQSVSTAVNQFAGNEFPGSGGVKLGPDGHVYIGNYGDALPNANGTQVWRYRIAEDSMEVFATGLSGASGNDFDSQGNLFQANISGNRLSKITPAGVVSTFATGFSAPVGVVVDPDGEIYVCNCGNNTIAQVDTAGNVSTFSSGPLFACPNGITRDPDGNLYVSNFNNGTVIKVDPSGSPSLFTSAPGNNNGHLTYSPIDSALYLASHGSSRIYRIPLDNPSPVVIAGSGSRGNANGPALSATFSRPNGIAFSSTGDTIFVNSSIPTSNTGFPLNPSVLRMVTGLINPIGLAPSWTETVDLRVFPVPVRGAAWVQVDFLGHVSGTIRLVDVKGRVLKEEVLEGGKEKKRWALPEGLAPGLHTVSYEFGAGSISRRFVVLE